MSAWGAVSWQPGASLAAPPAAAARTPESAPATAAELAAGVVAAGGWPTRLCSEGGRLNGAALTSDGRRLWSAADERGAMRLRVWSVDTAQCERTHEIGVAAWAVCAHAGVVYVGAADGAIHRFLETGAQPGERFEGGGTKPVLALEAEPRARPAWQRDGASARERGPSSSPPAPTAACAPTSCPSAPTASGGGRSRGRGCCSTAAAPTA